MKIKFLRPDKSVISLAVVAIFVALSGCSTEKNTVMSRFYHSFTTRYNVKFNGKESYRDGIEALQKANVDDYTATLPMYPVSNVSSQATAVSQMDKTIEKSRKAVKTHSITKKPFKSARRWSNPKYQKFYNQQEFNSALKESWLMLGKAEFHKGDFLGSAGTFSYISKHYPEDKDLVAQCNIWTARAFIETGWTYEAEEILSKIDQTDLKHRHRPLFDDVNAQLLLKQKQYARAIPYLQRSLDNESNKYQRARIAFILGQLHKNKGDTKAANSYFTKVIRMNPPYEMSFYARVNRIDVNDKNFKKNHRQLVSMIKNQNNKEYLDQLFYTNALVYLAEKDTVKALNELSLAADSSSRNGIDKAKALVLAGDLYYSQRNYVKAYPCYSEAENIIPPENDLYPRISNLASILGELSAENQIVLTNDSLLQIAALPTDEQLAIINKQIEEKKKADEELEKKSEQAKRAEQNSAYNPFEDDSKPAQSRIAGASMSGTGANWYFYNADLIKTGKSEFRRKWGSRRLEDNWRRLSKSNTIFAANDQSAAETENSYSDDNASEEASEKEENAKPSSDPYDPQFYLQQLPVSRAAKAQANEKIADALFNMGTILKDKLEDFPSAMGIFSEYERRFGNHEKLPDAYFQQFIMMARTHNQAQSGVFRSKILNEYPESRYALILQNPDFEQQQKRMFAEQDSLYGKVYTAYMHNDFQAVFANSDYVKTNFPNSKLLPKFDFLCALSVGRTQGRDTFATKLNNLIETYPQADVTPMAKDILALVNQGRENQRGGSAGNLSSLREKTLAEDNKANAEELTKSFSTNKMSKHRLMLNAVAAKSQMNELIYQVAVYNFSRFMIKDFDLIMTNIDTVHNILSVTNLENFDEARWYEKSLAADTVIAPLFAKLNITPVVISEENYALLQGSAGLEKYLAFEKQLENRTSSPTLEAQNSEQKESADNKLVTLAPKSGSAGKNVNQTVEIKVLELAEEPKAEISEQQSESDKEAGKQQAAENQTAQPATEPAQTPAAKPPYQMYKNLFAIQPEAQHCVTLYVLNGKVDREKTETAFNNYNADNYGLVNLNVSFEHMAGKEVIIIGTFPNAETAKSYLLRMVKERTLFDGLKGATYRNLIGTRQNLETATASAANLNIYLEFMKEYYLK
ncbi:MAG: tetratricopeptide repeat protein [Prevotellaceae bacterium]|nr:tetratricopeptide repeat protein [Prevotellaceae bacterium]